MYIYIKAWDCDTQRASKIRLNKQPRENPHEAPPYRSARSPAIIYMDQHSYLGSAACLQWIAWQGVDVTQLVDVTHHYQMIRLDYLCCYYQWCSEQL